MRRAVVRGARGRVLGRGGGPVSPAPLYWKPWREEWRGCGGESIHHRQQRAGFGLLWAWGEDRGHQTNISLFLEVGPDPKKEKLNRNPVFGCSCFWSVMFSTFLRILRSPGGTRHKTRVYFRNRILKPLAKARTCIIFFLPEFTKGRYAHRVSKDSSGLLPYPFFRHHFRLSQTSDPKGYHNIILEHLKISKLRS